MRGIRTSAIVLLFENAIMWTYQSLYLLKGTEFTVPRTTVSCKTLQNPQRVILGIMVLYIVHGDISGKRGEHHNLVTRFVKSCSFRSNRGVTCDSPAYLNNTFKFPVTISPLASLWWAVTRCSIKWRLSLTQLHSNFKQEFGFGFMFQLFKSRFWKEETPAS
jgi:hypothetical protein